MQKSAEENQKRNLQAQPDQSPVYAQNYLFKRSAVSHSAQVSVLPQTDEMNGKREEPKSRPAEKVRPPAEKKNGRKTKRRKIAPAGVMALLLLIASLVLLAGIILVQFVFFNETSQPTLAEEDRVSGRLVLSLDSVDATKTYPFGTSLLLQVHPDKIAVLNLKGTEEYSLDTTVQNIVVQQAENRVLLVDRLGYQYHVLQANGVLYSGRTDEPILGYHLSDEGYLALFLESEGTKGIVRVLQPNGDFLFDWTIQDDKESGYVLAAKFGVESKSLYVSMLNVAGAKPFPIIKKISLEEDHFREIVAQYSPQVFESLPVILPLAHEQTVFVGASSLYLLEGSELLEPMSLNRVARAGQVGRGFYLLAANQTGGAFYLNMVNGVRFPTSVDNGYVLNDVPREIACSKAYMAMSIGDDLYRFSLSSNQPEIFHMQGKLLRLAISDEGNILCVCSDGVRQITK